MKPLLSTAIRELVAELKTRAVSPKVMRHAEIGESLAARAPFVELYGEEFDTETAVEVEFQVGNIANRSTRMDWPLDRAAQVIDVESGRPMGTYADIETLSAWLWTELSRQENGRAWQDSYPAYSDEVAA